MKSILKLGIAAVLALTPAAVFAATGDAIFFSTSNTDPNAGSTLTLGSIGASAPLYIWVTSSSAANDITPASTALTGGGSPTGAAAIAFNGAITGTSGATGTITSGQFYNYDPAVPASNIYAYAGTPLVSRWSAATPTVSGTSFSNFTANTAMQSPNGTTFPQGTITGLSRANTTGSQNADPLYFQNAVVANGSTGGAWLLGVLNVQATANGDSTLQLSASNLDITKSGPAPIGTQVLTNGFSYGSALISVSTGRTGDINGDTKVDALDIDLWSARFAAGGLPYDIKYDYRGVALGSPPDGVISQPDKDRLVGSLIDINGVPTSVGTRYGDANLSGGTNFADFQILQNNFGGSGKGWATGDFDGNGLTNFADFQILQNNFGQSGGTGQVAAVPEPATLVLCGLGLIGLVGLRRKK